MILGIGTDICDIRRIRSIYDRHPERFPAKAFTEAERKKCLARPDPVPCLAKRFAAKEAVAKALATEESGELSWHDVEVINRPSGRPDVKLHGGAAERLASILPAAHTAHVRLSLSDERDFAVAFAVVEARPE
ncbi:holo-ACP synthase [Algimonas porphyrae]|uniref:Holo-[acyl-carrier-protein] synthase n=1 Tax=Algimonas porphyrae TaxID=1128113 RepID=A0ABQ5UZ61_9PROT|nr:holo-ACP synthase [Algimonas porphyrae]GLQ20050.1 holo-[acyl-carrier-protein] synthase [Algimonas porphyrae]